MPFESRKATFESPEMPFESRKLAFQSHEMPFESRETPFQSTEMAFQSPATAALAHDLRRHPRNLAARADIFGRGLVRRTSRPPIAPTSAAGPGVPGLAPRRGLTLSHPSAAESV
ncbi:MAG TPA: hypothetical protein VEB22_13540 [Phycisphaerales bacterium]|nr:hypothetical protein [Phycisphaerales bacterium]